MFIALLVGLALAYACALLWSVRVRSRGMILVLGMVGLMAMPVSISAAGKRLGQPAGPTTDGPSARAGSTTTSTDTTTARPRRAYTSGGFGFGK